MSISPAAQKISDAAVLHFAEKGYDAASLNTIADAVGIRKATIYSHFRNKDELFLHIFREATAVETAFVSHCFAQDVTAGEGYLAALAHRYRESSHLRLLLRSAFVPPEVARHDISAGYEQFLAQISTLFSAGASAQTSLTPAQLALLSDAYLGVVDSVHVELLYAGADAAERRQHALWQVFTTAVAAFTSPNPATSSL